MRPLLLIGALGVAGIAAAAANELLAHYEEPEYKVDRKDGDFELRAYPGVIAASVQVSGSDENAANEAFRILAGYIFGKNRAAKKIAMTVPVVQELRSEKIAMTVPVTMKRTGTNLTMSFYMPSKYTLDTLPVPINSGIKLERVPARKIAVVKFSGFASERSCRVKEEELKAWIHSQNLEKTGEPLRAFYNPPWALPFLRRNEIWIPI